MPLIFTTAADDKCGDNKAEDEDRAKRTGQRRTYISGGRWGVGQERQRII